MDELQIGDRCRIEDDIAIKDEHGKGIVMAIYLTPLMTEE